MAKLASNGRHNNALSYLNGVQVVGGSNPPTPTINLASKSPLSFHNVAPRLCLVNTLVNTFVNAGVYQKLPLGALKEINKCQFQLRLSDRTLAKLLGISVSFLSFVKHGKKPVTVRFLHRLRKLDVESIVYAVEVLPRKYALVCMETNSNANLTPVRQVVERFLVAKQLEGCAKDTIRFYRENLVRFLWWGERNALLDEVSKIDVQCLRDFLYYVQTAKERFGGRSVSARRLASPSTVDAYWRTLQSLFAWLVREGIVSPGKNPMVRIPRPRVPEKVTQDIPLDLISKVLESYDNSSFLSVRNRAIILVTCATPTPHLC